MTDLDRPGDHTVIPTGPHAHTVHDERLRGSLGVTSIIFMVVAAAAPLTAVGGVFPLQAMLGDGVGTPALTLASSVVLLLFTVGLTTMARLLPRPGAFFTYVGHGLGRPAGVAAAWLAVLTYTAAQVGIVAMLGSQLQSFIAGTLNGPDVAWWIYSLVMLAITGILGYRHLELSAKVLGVMLVLEIGIVLLLAVVALFQGGHDGVSMDSFRWGNITSGSPGLGLMFAIASFLGFESTAIFRDEAKDPERTVPRATYGAVIVIAVFYTFTQWALILAVGVDRFPGWIPDHVSDFIMVLASDYLGGFGAKVVNLLLITSLYACVLSFHNVLNRYGHSMGIAHALPRAFSRVHRQHGSPYVAATVQVSLAAVMTIAFAAFGLDPILQVFTWFGGVAMFTIVVLMAVASLAVIVYLARPDVQESLWKTWVAPGLGLLGLLFVAYMQIKNFPLLLGEPSVTGRVVFFYVLIAAFPVFGLVQALWLRARRPASYREVLEVIEE
jgi:amino acid transporter